MFFSHRLGLVILGLFAAALGRAVTNPPPAATTPRSHGLVGVGRLPAGLKDKWGETFGSLSALTLAPGSWARQGDTFTGTLLAQPDRGYNVAGTTDYASRLNVLTFTFVPAPTGATGQDQVRLTLRDTVLYHEAAGTRLTSLDPLGAAIGRQPTWPPLPQAGNGKISLDPEGLVCTAAGDYYVSDEYGPYLYHFSATGTLLNVIRPPAAFIPTRQGADSFSSNNPGAGQPAPKPANPVTGRQNNQGLEGLTLSPDGRTLFALLQSATRQDGGAGGDSATRGHTRLLAYDLSGTAPVLAGEYVLVLPTYQQGNAVRVAAASEVAALNDHQLLVLARDGGGHGAGDPTSVYRRVLLYDLANATNLAGTGYDSPDTPVAPRGELAPSVVAARGETLIDLNDAAQLAKFGLRNGAPDDTNNLSEKWESLTLAPALDDAAPHDVYLFVGNDNDFLTRDGFQADASYHADLDVDTMVLVYRLTLPTYVAPRSTFGRHP